MEARSRSKKIKANAGGKQSLVDDDGSAMSLLDFETSYC